MLYLPATSALPYTTRAAIALNPVLSMNMMANSSDENNTLISRMNGTILPIAMMRMWSAAVVTSL
jgi:hypothetical protein